MYHSLKNDAIFIADSHYNKKNQEFLTFLKKLDSFELNTSQLILMGDNFDFISGESKYFIKIDNEPIEILNRLSKRMEIIYLEGNHDYNLQTIFPNIKVIKREKQPLFLQTDDKKTVALSHGDNFINWKYDLYCAVIRNHYLLKFLNFIDINYFISIKIENALLGKNICHQINNFQNLVNRRINNYKTDIIIEGHYHQGKSFCIDNQIYINVPSLCCSKEYLKFNENEFKKEVL